MDKYKNIAEAMEQLEKCKFVDEIGHPIENNTAFIYLKKIAQKNPILIGDEIEVEVFGEIAEVKTSIKRKGFVNKIEETFCQWDGRVQAKRRTIAYVYINKPNVNMKVKDMKPFKSVIVSEDK